MGLKTIIAVPILVVVIGVLFIVGREHIHRLEHHVQETGVVLLTGTSNGFGRHAVFTLAKQGYHVFGTVRNDKSFNELSKEAKSLNLESFVHPILMDVSNSSQIDQAFLTISQYVNKTSLPFVGLINNAGVLYISPFETMKEDKMRNVMDTNCIGSLVVTQVFFPLLKEFKGRVLFVTGFNGFVSRYAHSIYSASKHCIEASVESIRLDFFRFNISVSSILPGCITTSPKKVKNPTDKVDIPGELIPIYGEKMKKILKMTTRGTDSCTSPSVVSDTMLFALRNPFPQIRYYVGETGSIIPLWLWRFLKTVMFDRMYDLVRDLEVYWG